VEKTTFITLPVTGMTCANCVATVERNIKKLDGIENANVNLTTERASVEYDPELISQDEITARIRRAENKTLSRLKGLKRSMPTLQLR